MPYIGILSSLAMKKPLQWLDTGFPCCKKTYPDPTEEE
jgi:hypothetical protein